MTVIVAGSLMAKIIRYALATFCFAASVGCLALWWRSETFLDRIVGPLYQVPCAGLQIESFHGIAAATWLDDDAGQLATEGWMRLPAVTGQPFHTLLAVGDRGLFGVNKEWGIVFFPHWYPALVFALAAVAVLRLGRFTLRSAIIATTVVAGLLGMAVGM
jgi:hypothetical protein